MFKRILRSPLSILDERYGNLRPHQIAMPSLVLGLLTLIISCPTTQAQDRPSRRDRIEDRHSTDLLNRQRQNTRRVQDVDPTLMRFRTIDGSYNNLDQTHWGLAGARLWRRVPSAYADGLSEMARADMPSPRSISNLIFNQTESTVNERGLTDMVWQWGQFLDHDLSLTHTHEPLEYAPVQVPSGDVWFDPTESGGAVIQFFRSEYNEFASPNVPREQLNVITSWIDGSNVYGSDETTANNLRLFRNGMLRVSANATGHLLPVDEDGFFLAGDVRANEQAYLTAMHTLFMREHNRLCRELLRALPDLTDEQLYRHARKRNIATMQAITYNEFLPALLGNPIAPYRGYNPNVFPNITNCFSTSAYRFGHTMLSSELLRLDPDGNTIPEGNLSLADAFFDPDLIKDHGIDPYLRGLIANPAQEVDAKLIGDVRNFLFGPPGAGGFDLASLNIQRGRDHGLPGLNEIRVRYGLPPLRSFEDLSDDPETILQLAELYGTVDQIDPWVGMLCEKHVPGSSLGLTAYMVIRDQFERLRDGDRFWYQHEFQGAAVQRFEQTRLSDIIRLNSGIKQIRRDVFRLPN